MSTTLYDLTAEYMVLLDMAEDPDIDPQAFADTLEALGGEIEMKADGYARAMKQLEGISATVKYEYKRLENRAKTIDKNIARMKQALQDSMIATGKTKFKTDLFSFTVRKNPASVVIDRETSIPPEFLIPQDPKIDKKAIKAAIDRGDDITFAHLEQGESLIIR
jgi:cell division protein YceG involved in septum cleavage